MKLYGYKTTTARLNQLYYEMLKHPLKLKRKLPHTPLEKFTIMGHILIMTLGSMYLMYITLQLL